MNAQPRKANLSKRVLRLLIAEEMVEGMKVSDSESSNSIVYFFGGVSSMVEFRLSSVAQRISRLHQSMTTT